MTEIWEYRELSGFYDKDLGPQLATMGALGWEAVGLGIVEIPLAKDLRVVLMKRRMKGLPAPEDNTTGWHPDPTKRHRQRWWDGLHWTEHVISTTGENVVDLPIP